MKTAALFLLSSLTSVALGGVLKNYNANVAPEMTDLPSQYAEKHPGAKRVKIRYGPFKQDGADHKGLMYLLEGEKGVLTTIKPTMKKPCTECTLLGMQAGLEYADGTDASIDTGAWLHHMVMTSVGSGRKDLTCPVTPGERFFSSGNERTVTGMADPKPGSVKTGFRIHPKDTHGMEIELMNLNKEAITTYLTLTYDFLDGPTPEDFKHTRAVWFDVTGCFKASEMKPKNDGKFEMSSDPWTSPVTGDILGIGGHVHDGGLSVSAFQNDREFCKSEATYGGSPKFIQRADTRDGGMAHISHMSFCQDVGPIKQGDKFYITSRYDMKAHMPMRNAKGSLSTVMGIAIMYVIV
jgi:hypothetical protein